MIEVKLTQDVLPRIFTKGVIIIMPDGRIAKVTEGISHEWKIVGVETTPDSVNMFFDDKMDGSNVQTIVHKTLRPMELDK